MRWSVEYVRVNRRFSDGTAAVTDVLCTRGSEEAARELFAQLAASKDALRVIMRVDGDVVERSEDEEPLPARARLSLRTKADGFSSGDVVVDADGRRWHVHCMLTRLLPGKKHELIELSLRERADGGAHTLLPPSQVTLAATV